MKGHLFGLAAAAALIAGAVSAPLPGASNRAAAAEANWKMHVVWVDARLESQAFRRFAELADEKAGDKLDIAFFSGGALGIKDVDMLRILPPGAAIQAAGLYPGYMTRDEPEYAYTLPPGVVSEAQTLVDLLPTLTTIYQKTYDKWGIDLLGYVQHPVQKTHIFCKEPVQTLEELKGKKLRVWEKFHVDVFSKLGVAAQVIGQNDLYVALQTGVVDCAVYPVGFAKSVSIQEVAPYASYLFPYVLHPLNIIVSKKAFESLSPEAQEALRSAAAEVQQETNDRYLAGTYDAEAAKELEALGTTILEPFPEDDRKLFAQTARQLWKERTEEHGGAAVENYKLVTQAAGM